MEQICNLCEKSLVLDDFRFRKDTQKYSKTCKKCFNKAEWQKRKNGLINHRKKFEFVCIKCNTQKTDNDFYVKDKSKNRYDTTCKECRKNDSKEWHFDNYEKSKENKKKWHTLNRENNLEKMREYHKNRMETEPDKVREQKKQWADKNREKVQDLFRERYENDINFKLGQNLRQSCREAIKDGRPSALLDCHGLFARKWLEFQFIGDMSWENYGKVWNIDHFVPITLFDLEDPDQQKACFNWKNIQPLLIQKNLSKGNKIPTTEEMSERNTKIDEFQKPLEI